jgi:phosphotransferase system IIB component
VRSVATAASRLRVDIQDAARLDRAALAALGLRGVALPRPDCVHLLVGPSAPAAAAALRELLGPAAA